MSPLPGRMCIRYSKFSVYMIRQDESTKKAGKRSESVFSTHPRVLDELNKKLEDTLCSCSSWCLKEKCRVCVSHFVEVFSRCSSLCTRPSSDTPSSQGISVGCRQHGRYVKTRLEKTASFIVVKLHDVPPQHTHTYILPAALTRLKDYCGWRLISFLWSRVAKISKSGQWRSSLA